MSLLLRFNVIAMLIFLIGLVVAEYMALRDLRARVHSDLIMTAKLADYLIEIKSQRLQFDFQHSGSLPDENFLQRVFQLERLENLKYLNIEFISRNGMLLDSNNVGNDVPVVMPDWLFKLLSDYLYESPIVKPVNLAGQKLGEIHISHNLDSEINEIWQTSKEMILPLLLVFLLGSLMIVVLASLVVKPAEKLLKISRQMTRDSSLQPHKRFAGISGLLNAGHELNDIGRQLQNHNHQLRELNGQMLKIHEDERKRLSAELHDEIGQHLTAIRFDTATIASARNLTEAQHAGASIDKINRQLNDIIRSMLQRLRPPSLDSAGLKASLIEFTGEWQLRHPQHNLSLNIKGDLMAFSDSLNLTIYRAVQESLTNILRYAGEKVSINIDLQQAPERLQLTISDDGYGCDPHIAGNGFGLLAMRERVEALAGEFTVLSAPGAGLTVTLSIPL